jgi:hypothetical protein
MATKMGNVSEEVLDDLQKEVLATLGVRVPLAAIEIIYAIAYTAGKQEAKE